jgi:hypothetical protein
MDVQLFRHKSSSLDIKQHIQAEEKGQTLEKRDPILLWWTEQFDPFITGSRYECGVDGDDTVNGFV